MQLITCMWYLQTFLFSSDGIHYGDAYLLTKRFPKVQETILPYPGFINQNFKINKKAIISKIQMDKSINPTNGCSTHAVYIDIDLVLITAKYIFQVEKTFVYKLQWLYMIVMFHSLMSFAHFLILKIVLTSDTLFFLNLF